MTTKQLSERAVADMKYILADDQFMLNLLVDEEKKIAKHVSLNSDGSITIGKTKYGWLNRLLGAERTIGFDDFVLRLIDFMAGHISNRNEIAKAGMSQDFIKQRFGQYDRDEIVEMVFAYYRFGYKTGNYHNPEEFQKWISQGNQQPGIQPIQAYGAVRDQLGGVAILIPDITKMKFGR